MTYLWCSSTWIFCFVLVPSTISDSDTFSRFCKHPGQFGKGTLESATKCTVKFPKSTKKRQDAVDFCNKVSPYPTEASTEGKPTTCVYRREYTCDDHENDIFDHCFVVKEPTGEPFSPDACPEGYSLHVVTSKKEFMWIAVVFEDHKKVWVGNSGDSASWLQPKERKKIRKRDNTAVSKQDERPIFICLKDGYMDGTKRGSAYYGDPKWVFPYLCSREADAFEETIESDNHFLGTLGFDTFSITGKDGRKRSYISFHKMYAVKSKKYEAEFTDIHSACKVVKGHVAAREDFESEEDYRKVLNKYGPWMIRTTVGRSPSFTMDPMKDCGKDPFFEANRKKWSYYDKNGSELAITANVWSPNHPDSTCADLPRITALMYATGYIDVPAISRRPFVCVTGVPAIDRKVRRRDETCNRAAKYDATKKHCVCNNPDADGLVVDPKLYAHYPPGTICMDCHDTTEGRAIVFLLDTSGSVGQGGWDKQLQFMRTIANSIKNIRTGVVFISSVPTIELQMSHYTKADLDKWIDRHQTFPAGGTNVWRPVKYATDMLRKEPVKHKIIMIFSDGTGGYEAVREANQARKEGIRIIYIAVGEYVDPSNRWYEPSFMEECRQMAGSDENLIKVGLFERLDMSIMDNVVKTMCDPIV